MAIPGKKLFLQHGKGTIKTRNAAGYVHNEMSQLPEDSCFYP
jgi:hypothetical protein